MDMKKLQRGSRWWVLFTGLGIAACNNDTVDAESASGSGGADGTTDGSMADGSDSTADGKNDDDGALDGTGDGDEGGAGTAGETGASEETGGADDGGTTTGSEDDSTSGDGDASDTTSETSSDSSGDASTGGMIDDETACTNSCTVETDCDRDKELTACVDGCVADLSADAQDGCHAQALQLLGCIADLATCDDFSAYAEGSSPYPCEDEDTDYYACLDG